MKEKGKVQSFYQRLANLAEVIVLLLLYIIKPFKFIKLMWVFDERIGHFACSTDLFLRRLQLGIIKGNGILYIGIASTKPCNNQLLKMLKRKLPIIQTPGVKAITSPVASATTKKSLIRRSPFYQELPFYSNEYYEFNNGEPSLDFTSDEEKRGKELLNQMSIDSWFICFHSRDPVYLSTQKDKWGRTIDWSHHTHRDSDIINYLEAAKYITFCGGFALRMGAYVAEKLPDLNNPRIIDYAIYYRTDFGDIYLPSKCKFFLGNTAGICWLSTIFNVPVACANVIPIGYAPLSKRDLFITKKIWSIEKKRLLTFREILESGGGSYLRSEQYARAGLEPIENTPEEILDLAREMNEHLDGNFEYTEEDQELQDKYQSIYRSCSHRSFRGIPPRIGTEFLRQNRELLE